LFGSLRHRAGSKDLAMKGRSDCMTEAFETIDYVLEEGLA
jgi:hypothetical protein